MKLNKEDITVLRDLFSSINGLTPYIFYQRHQYSPSTVFKSLEKLVKNEFVKSNENRYSLTEKGRRFTLKRNLQLSGSKFDRIPNDFKAIRLGINEPYLPDINDLSNEILNK